MMYLGTSVKVHHQQDMIVEALIASLRTLAGTCGAVIFMAQHLSSLVYALYAVKCKAGKGSPVEMRKLQVRACCIKTLLGNLALVNQGLKGLEALQKLVNIVHQLQTGHHTMCMHKVASSI